MSAELEIPNKARIEMLQIESDWDDDAILDNSIRAVARPVVAAELRSQADHLDGYATALANDYGLDLIRAVAANLRYRAAELDAS